MDVDFRSTIEGVLRVFGSGFWRTKYEGSCGLRLIDTVLWDTFHETGYRAPGHFEFSIAVEL